MKWLRTLILFDTGNIIASSDWKMLHESYHRAITSIDHPIGSGILRLRKKVKLGQNQWQRNGVSYLRRRFLDRMKEVENWKPESIVNLARDRDRPTILLYPSLEDYQEPITSDFGNFDFVTVTESGLRVVIEWETGNISSSHRSLNKLAIALENGIIDIGVLIVPSRDFYEHLTDRIGNIGELSGYLSLWAGLKSTVDRGLLAITVVEHDELTDDPSLAHLPVGSDGHAKKIKMQKT
jgi:Restriction endonuclease BamHI